MKTMQRRMAAFASCTLLLAACSVVTPSEPSALYDLGPAPASAAASLPALPPLSLAGIGAPAWLDSTAMYYRLNYANEQQPHPYAQARWTMPPAQLLQQALRARIVRNGGVVLSASDGVASAPVLRVDVDDFTQSFSAPDKSSARISLLASVFEGRKLIAQKSFQASSPAPGADAASGARAMAQASDAAIGELVRWLATLQLK